MAWQRRNWDHRRRQGLADWDISRDAPYFGIAIPDAPGKYFYVWLDAPIGYLASLKAHLAEIGIDFATFLQSPDVDQYHFIGKDIVYFHTLFWPAMLKFAGAPYKVPDNVFVHGFITASGEKMSKSRGTGVSPDVYLDLGLDPEWLRYYIAAKLNAKVEDIDFNPDDFIARVNSDLDRQVRQHREPRGDVHHEVFRRQAVSTAAKDDELVDAHRHRPWSLGDPRRNRGGLRGARVRQGAARGDAHRRSHQRTLRPGEAVGAREGSVAARRAAGRVHGRAQCVSRADLLPGARASGVGGEGCADVRPAAAAALG